MGGGGLAAPAAASGTAALAALKQSAQAISATPSGEAAWVGAAYSPPADDSAAAVDSGWRWYNHPARNEFKELLLSAEVNSRPVADGEARWAPGFPKLYGARFVGIEAQSSVESCAALRWPRGSDGSTWENFACSSRAARFFICRFPDADHGMTAAATAVPVAPPASTAVPAGVPGGRLDGGSAPSYRGVAAEDFSGSATVATEEDETFWDSLPVGRELAMGIGAGCVVLLLMLCGCCLWAMRTPAGRKITTRSESHIIRKALSKKLVTALQRGSKTGGSEARSKAPGAEAAGAPHPGLTCISSEVFGAAGVHGAILQTPVKPQGRVREIEVDESPYVELPDNLGETTVVSMATGGGTPAAQAKRKPRPWSAPRASGGSSVAARASGEGDAVKLLDSLGESEELNWSPPVAIPWLADSHDTSQDADSPAAVVRCEVAEAMRARPATTGTQQRPKEPTQEEHDEDSLMRQDSGTSNRGWRDRQAMSMHRELALAESQFAASPPSPQRQFVREEHARTRKGDVVTRLIYRRSAHRQSPPLSADNSPSHADTPPAANQAPREASPTNSAASHHTATPPQPARGQKHSVNEIHLGEHPGLVPSGQEQGAVHSSHSVQARSGSAQTSSQTTSTTPRVELSAADIVRFSAVQASQSASSPATRPTPPPLAFPTVDAGLDSPAPTPSFPATRPEHHRVRSREATDAASPSADAPGRSSYDPYESSKPSDPHDLPTAAASIPRSPLNTPPRLAQEQPSSHSSRPPTESPPRCQPPGTIQPPGRPMLTVYPHKTPLHASSAGTPHPSPTGAHPSGSTPPSADAVAASSVSPAAPADGGATTPRQRLRGMPITPMHAAAIAHLHEQLDERIVNAAAGDYGTLDGQYEMLGPHERLIGGQGIVQFARLAEGARMVLDTPEPQVALKFYVQPELILPESTVYSSPSMHAAGVLPRTGQFMLNTDKRLKDSAGVPLPPCFIMERGVSLKSWISRKRGVGSGTQTMNSKTAIKAMLHVTQCLASLHAAGFVHRDVKPGSIVWLPSEHRWALANFCRACRPGHTGAAPCSLAYAAPEVAAAVGPGAEPPLPAAKAADVWALGVVIYELFSRERALDVRHAGVDGVLEQLRGERKLAWEAEDGFGLRCLGPLAGAVAPLLHRDPAKRPDVASFLDAATRALEGALRPLNGGMAVTRPQRAS